VVSVDGILICEIIVVPDGLQLTERIFRAGDDSTTCHPINFEDTPTLRDFSANLCQFPQLYFLGSVKVFLNESRHEVLQTLVH
jgi:hypothetical protein